MKVGIVADMICENEHISQISANETVSLLNTIFSCPVCGAPAKLLTIDSNNIKTTYINTRIQYPIIED